MMLIRGSLEKMVREVRYQRDQAMTRNRMLIQENEHLKGRVAEMERTLERDMDYLHG
jgi:regulator of replication initiation timing